MRSSQGEPSFLAGLHQIPPALPGKKGKNEISMRMESYGKPQERDWGQVGKSVWFFQGCMQQLSLAWPRALGSRIPPAGGVTVGMSPCLRRDSPALPMDVLEFQWIYWHPHPGMKASWILHQNLSRTGWVLLGLGLPPQLLLCGLLLGSFRGRRDPIPSSLPFLHLPPLPFGSKSEIWV